MINKHTKKQKLKPIPSELRQDIITGDWVVIATGRAKKPEEFREEKKDLDYFQTAFSSKEYCPFCDGRVLEQEKDTLIYYKDESDWSLRVFPNKYPAFSRNQKVKHKEDGVYFSMSGVGYHEVIVSKDHERGIPFMIKEEVAEVIDAFRTRYLEVMNRKSINYILFIENHGYKAGASIAHPHWQMFAIPVISPGIKLELDGARLYDRSNRNCVYCTMIIQETKTQKRVIFENSDFIAFVPFASRSAFEVWILPKKHQSYFERIKEEEEFSLAEILKKVLERYYWNLNDIPYNMYLHTAPCNGQDYSFYHWHLELLPKTSTWAGFELGTGIEISTIEPEIAAEFLRKESKAF